MKRTRSYLNFLLPLFHTCLCAAIALGLNKAEGSWKWFAVFWVDFPMSILLLPLLRIFHHPLIVFGIAGGLWWFLISALATVLFRKMLTSLHRRRAEAQPRP